MSINDQTSLENLQSCAVAAQAALSIIEQNNIITEYNNTQKLKLGAAIDAWQQRKVEFTNGPLADWTNSRGKYSIHKDRLVNQAFTHPDVDWTIDCSTCFNACNYYQANRDWNNGNCKTEARKRGQPYSDDYFYNGTWRHQSHGGDGACGKKKASYDCSRTQTSIDAAIEAYKNDKPQFNEPMPSEDNEKYVLKNTIPNNLVIQCCANINNTIGDVTNQLQTCKQSIDASISQKNQSGFINGSDSSNPSTDTIPNTTSSNPSTDTTPNTTSSNPNLQFPSSIKDLTPVQYGVIVLVLLICLSSLSISSLLVLDE